MLRQIVFKEKTTKFKRNPSVDWQRASDLQEKVEKIVQVLNMDWIDTERIFCFRSEKSKANAYARIWGLSQIWQQALQTDAAYCLEVLSEKFDRLSDAKKDEVLIHELVHIPKTFSGSLRPHTKRGKWRFHDTVDDLVREYRKAK